MEITKQFLRRGRDFNRNGNKLMSPSSIGLYDLKNNLPKMNAFSIAAHQDQCITTVFHFIIDGNGNIIQTVPINECAKIMPSQGEISILIVPEKEDGSLSKVQTENLCDLLLYIKEHTEIETLKEFNVRAFDNPEDFAALENVLINGKPKEEIDWTKVNPFLAGWWNFPMGFPTGVTK
ncbi:MAG: hypothetical protein HUJ68_11630 [Clostridia bacterium]|nr:hypothetical protein [Clostridia bacterium]